MVEEVRSLAFWFCLTHMAVEPDEGCAHVERLGPYETRAEAQAALDKAHERTEAWDRDPRWHDEEE